jgi:predicted kinase
MDTAGLTAQQPLLILVIGIPGSGKSYFARKFTEAYKFFYVNTERYAYELSLKIDTDQAKEVAKKLSLATLEQTFGSFKHMILEGPFDTLKERLEIADMAKLAGFKLLVVWVQTDEETALTRTMNRDRRRADDRHALMIDQEGFNELNSKFEQPVVGRENFVVISGKHNFDSQGLVVLKKIASVYVAGMKTSANSVNAQAMEQRSGPRKIMV